MQKGPVPLVFGVTGHRDLRAQDLARLRSIVGDIFAEFRTSYASGPIVLLSSLAEGADRLVAQVGLEQGVKLIVPLPMKQEEYQTDFKTQESRAEFTRLLSQADSVFVSPGDPDEGPAEPEAEGSRSRLYAKAGHYILQHCHILIALWDGDPAEKTGGTSQMVRQKREGLPLSPSCALTILDIPESGTVFHLVTPRDSNPDPPGAFELKRLAAHSSEKTP
jgi:hypothetical protein